MKNSLKKAFALASLGAVAVSAASMNAFAEANNGLTADEIASAAVKPTITLTKEVISLDEAKANPQRNVEMVVSGADAAYASTGFHVYFDKRLDCPANKITKAPTAKSGAALEYLMPKTPNFDPTADEQGMKGIFLTTAGDLDGGQDGVIWNITLNLPDDVAAGDVFGLDIIYKSNPSAEDLFTNKAKNKDGAKMQGWTFTQGIYNSDTNNNFAAPAADVAKCAALASIDKSFDGYIAIEDGATQPPTDPPTTPPTDPPTEPPTTKATTTTTKATTTTTAKPTTTTTKATTTDGDPANKNTTTSTTGGSTQAPGNDSNTTSSTTDTATSTTTTTTGKGGTTTKKGDGTTKKSDAPKTGVNGVGVAVAGLAVALGTAFVLRKKED